MKTKHLFQPLFLAGCLAGLVALSSHAADTTATPVGEATANKDVISRHHEQLNRGDVNTALQSYAPDTKNHGRVSGRDGLRRVLEDIYTTFPDWRMEIVEMIAVDDSVVVRCTVSGTHKGVGRLPVNGGMLVGVEPTGKRFAVQHIHWYKLRGGQIVDHLANRDDIGMLRQLGMVPPAPAAIAR
jgi:steroid delta-isomerase-like uncharacterized protein